MKRIINGVSYNTDTAQHIATASYDYEKRDGEEWSGSYDLYRTKGGAFFIVDIETPDDPTPWGYEREEAWKMQRVTFTPLTYDKAHEFVLGKGHWNIPVELLVNGIFPSIPEAEAAE
jgi:hypothetical protein